MAEPTLTRPQLRRELARRMKMLFAQRVGDSSTLTTGSTTTAARDGTALVQADDFWNDQFFYNVTRDAVRMITDFADTNNEATLEYAVTSQASGDTYEIHNIWSALDLHMALNAALEDSFPAFFDYVNDETLILCEDKLEYALTGLTSLPWRMTKVFIEQPTRIIRGIADSGSTSTLIDDSLAGMLNDGVSVTDGVTTGWKCAIYGGTNVGEIKTVSSVTAAQNKLTFSGGGNFFTSDIDSTSKYALWDPDVQREPWRRLLHVRFDQREWPNTLYLGEYLPHLWGVRLRLQYASKPSTLSAESSTTLVPREFLINRAMAILYGSMVDDTRVDRARYSALADYHNTLAEEYRRRRAFRQPDGTLWQEESHSLAGFLSVDDPLDWRGG